MDYIIQESIYHLKVKIFGNERLGLSSFIQLKQTATQLKISSDCNIKKWSQRFNTFQDYLPRCLWIAGPRRCEWPTAFGVDRKQEILEFSLPYNYLKALASEGWCLSKNTFEASIRKLVEIKPEILNQEKGKGKRGGGGSRSDGNVGHDNGKGATRRSSDLITSS